MLGIVLLSVLPNCLFGQKIGHMGSFRDINSATYFRLNYENDYFSSSDKNYTQGYNFELVLPSLKKNPVNFLFFKHKTQEIKYGLALEHIGFTPENYKSPEIQFGDRPFAAAIMLKSFMIAVDTVRKSRLVSSFSFGIIGPGAFGKEMQVGIHKITGNAIPQGWQNQIKNDIVLNYSFGHEKLLFRYRNLFSLQFNSILRVGTLFTNASAGFNTAVGIINKPFSSVAKKASFKIYFYSQPLINFIGYDATLQGGLFNDKSPYVVPSDKIERFTAQYNYGVVLQTKSLYFEYSRTLLTREFESGTSARWGGFKIGFTF